MEIEVKFFGRITDKTHNSNTILKDISNTSELRLKLQNLYPELTNMKYAIAVNKEIIQQDKLLKNNDIVAILPPYAGG
ncbi:MAG: MoaD/ThiS family protein [Chitinophagaceae bacterium]